MSDERDPTTDAAAARPDDSGEAAGPPETGDDVVDAATARLAAVPDDDLDGQLEAGEDVQRTLRARLGDLGG